MSASFIALFQRQGKNNHTQFFNTQHVVKNALVVEGIEVVISCCVSEGAHKGGEVRPKSL
jgi:hypothetical protein